MGEVHLIVGPMGSGKSTEFIREATGYLEVMAPILVVKPRLDSRSDGITTHSDMPSLPCLRPYRVGEIFDDPRYPGAYAVMIDEGQFFDGDELVAAVERMADVDGKVVHLYGLCGNYKQQPMWPIDRLISIADTARKLETAKCQDCARPTPAPFTVANFDMPASGIAPGGLDMYSAVCRRHKLLRAAASGK